MNSLDVFSSSTQSLTLVLLHTTFNIKDQDGKMDVLIANKIGSLFYYRNTGSFASPAFTLQPSLILTPYRGVKAAVSLHLAWGVNGLYAGLVDGTVEFYSLTRCQPTKPCNELGNCVFPNFQVSSCQCEDGVSGGLQCESCKSLYESTTNIVTII